MHRHEQTDERDDTVTRTLAEQLDLPVQEFIEVFGAGWQALPNAEHDFDALVGPWFIAGDPFQLMLRIRPDLEAVDVARPKGILAGHSLVWRPSPDGNTIPLGSRLLETAGPIVNAILKRRRQSFRYCRYCRQITAPENRIDADLCQGCASTWQGVVSDSCANPQ